MTGRGRGNRASISARVLDNGNNQVAVAARASVAPPRWVAVVTIPAANIVLNTPYALIVTPQGGAAVTRHFQFIPA